MQSKTWPEVGFAVVCWREDAAENCGVVLSAARPESLRLIEQLLPAL